MTTHRRCLQCRRRHPLTNYQPDKRTSDGLSNTCMSCAYINRKKYRHCGERFTELHPNPLTEAILIKVWKSGEDDLMPWQVDVQGFATARFGTQQQACRAAHVMFEYLTDGIQDKHMPNKYPSMTKGAISKRKSRERQAA